MTKKGLANHIGLFLALAVACAAVLLFCRQNSYAENPSGGSAESDETVLSDDLPYEQQRQTIGEEKSSYLWQSADAGILGSYPNVGWYAGYQFTFRESGMITELCGFFNNEKYRVDLYGSDYGLLASADIESRGNWNCVSIKPVEVEKNRDYYVAAKVESGSTYFKYQCCDPSLLPRESGGAEIRAGIKQDSNRSFGAGIKRYNYLVFGLVDVKYSHGKGLIVPASGNSRPVINGIEPSGVISNNRPILAVRTNRNTICKYDTSKKNYADLRYKFSKTGGLNHTKKLGTRTDGKYVYYARCIDGNGYKSYASKISFTVKNGSSADTEPPVISGLKPSGTVGGGSVTISVVTDEDANCKFSNKNRFYDSLSNSFASTGKKNHSAQTGPLNNGDYIYYVRCKDKAGNANISSSRIEFKVSGSGGDTTPPTISSVAVEPKSGSDTAVFTITAKVSDNTGVSSVKAEIQKPKGTAVTVFTLKDDGKGGDGAAGDGIYGVRLTSKSGGNGTYYVKVTAADAFSNTSVSDGSLTFNITGAGDGEGGDLPDECEIISRKGSGQDKIDIVIVPCNYGTDMASFESEARKQASQFLGFSPISENRDKFNICFIKKTGFVCESDLCNNFKGDISRFKNLSAKCGADATVVLAKGAVGASGCASHADNLCFVMSGVEGTMAHEASHVLFGLGDEYVYDSGGSVSNAWCGSGGQLLYNVPNCDVSGCSKWKALSGTSCLQGCSCGNNYRSAAKCPMNIQWEALDFCPVCSKYITDYLKNYK